MTAPASILIVDDEPTNCRLLQALVGPKATSREQRPAASRRRVARAVKANLATSYIPLMMVTAQSDQQARLGALDAGPRTW